MPCPGPLKCSRIADYVFDFVLSDPGIRPPVPARDVDHRGDRGLVVTGVGCYRAILCKPIILMAKSPTAVLY